jgi:RNA polymerase sigma factor (sigma-70 family)
VPDRDEDVTTVVDPPLPRTTSRRDRHDEFSALFRLHYPAVLAYCRRRTAGAEAADVAVAAFEVLWRRVAIDDPPHEPLPWLYRVAAQQLANVRRGEARRGRLVERLAGRRVPSTAPDAADVAGGELVARAALARLKPAESEALMLVAWEGLEPEDAAAAMGVSPRTFAVRLHRARRRLEQLLPELTTEDPS